MKQSANKDAAKKEREKYYLEKVISLYSEFPSGVLETSEEPDFLLTTSDGVIGIELVGYIRGQSSDGSELRRYESVHDSVVRMAKEEFERKHQIPLWVSFIWSRHQHLSKPAARILAMDIATLIEQNTPQQVYGGARIEPDWLEESSVGDFIAHISIRRLKPTNKSLWANTEAGFIGIEPEDLENLISLKEGKIGSYLQNCDSAWLVIVADGRHISSNVELHKTIHQHTFKCSFARVLFYDSVSQSIASLNVALDSA
jgi:hypothetical protein